MQPSNLFPILAFAGDFHNDSADYLYDDDDKRDIRKIISERSDTLIRKNKTNDDEKEKRHGKQTDYGSQYVF